MFNISRITGKQKVAENKVGQSDENPTSHDRLPPGQHLLTDPNQFPVLDLGEQPRWDKSTYHFVIDGLVENPIKLTYDEILALPSQEFTADFHCVTTWSKYDVKWKGVSFTELEKLVKPKPEAKYIIQTGLEGYTTNAPVDEFRKDNVFIAYDLYGKPLPAEHGSPLRMINPNLYAWKGAKFLTRIEYVAADHRGFWETRGYNNHGDPWKEERYS